MTTFTPEDGTGLATANAFCTTAFVDDYFALRGIIAWTGTTTVKEQAVVKATDYMEKRFGGLYKGSPAVVGQALSFPRADVVLKDGSTVDDASVPDAVKKAAAEYALRALTGELLSDPAAPGTTGGEITMIKKVVGPLEKTLQYAKAAAVGSLSPMLAAKDAPSYPAADLLLVPYLKLSKTVSRN